MTSSTIKTVLMMIIMMALGTSTDQSNDDNIIDDDDKNSDDDNDDDIAVERGVMVSMSAVLVCHQCWSAGPGLGWGFNFWTSVCGIF